jgi:hypothetical protein
VVVLVSLLLLAVTMVLWRRVHQRDAPSDWIPIVLVTVAAINVAMLISVDEDALTRVVSFATAGFLLLTGLRWSRTTDKSPEE